MDFPTPRLPHLPPPLAVAESNLLHLHKPLPLILFHRSLQHPGPQTLNVSPLISRQLAHTMADADSSITDSSLAPSTTPTSLLDSVAPVVPPSDRTDKADRRASLGLIDAARVRFSKDVSSQHASWSPHIHPPRSCLTRVVRPSQYLAVPLPPPHEQQAPADPHSTPDPDGRSREPTSRVRELCQGLLAHCRPGSAKHGRPRGRTTGQGLRG
ncbi:hypothetical protein C8Q78DRAFT_85990 [Trametes maxima]|nr:hypothetical protein C8Q78DRAFT_85990 [Trametes maxima]